MIVLYSRTARRRAITIWLERAQAAWAQVGRLYLQAFQQELDGTGDPSTCHRLKIVLARIHFRAREYQQQLRSLA